MSRFVELEISLYASGEGELASRKYRTETRFSYPGGEAEIRQEREKLPEVTFDLEELRKKSLAPREYGKLLTDSLFAQEALRKVYIQARASARSSGLPLQLRLLISEGANELQALFWEMLLDPEDGTDLGASQNVLLSRYLSSKDWRKVESVPKHALKALAAVANPVDLGDYQLAPLDVSGKLEKARENLGAILDKVLPREGCRTTLNNMIHDIEQGCDVVYLMCHGKLIGDQPWLWLEDQAGKTIRTSGVELVKALEALPRLPLLIVLASCESAGAQRGEVLTSLGPRLAKAGVPAVLAIHGEISLETLASFMPFFFDKLQKEGQIDQALAYARWAVRERPDRWMVVLFSRLKSGYIFRQEEDHQEAPQAQYAIPDPPKDFIGREKEIQVLLIQVMQGARAIGLNGGAGTGKSALARKLGRSLYADYPFGYEINLYGAAREGEKPLEWTEAMRRILRWLDQEANLPDSPEELCNEYRTRLRNQKVLLLLDNAKDEMQVKPLIPPAPSMAVVTSRAQIFLEDFVPLRLDVLPVGEAMQVLRTEAPRLKDESVGVVEKLAAECSCLPLALIVAGATLNRRPDWTVEAYLIRLADERKRLKVLRDPYDPDLDVGAALEISYQNLNTELRKRFRALAVTPAAFKQEAAAAIWDCGEDETEVSLGELLRQSMIEYQSSKGSGTYTLHDLPRVFAEEKLCESEAEARDAVSRHAHYYLELGSKAETLYMQGGEHVVEGLRLFDQALPHLRSAWERMVSVEKGWPKPDDAERWLIDYFSRTVHVCDLRLTAHEKITCLEKVKEAARSLGDQDAEMRSVNRLGAAFWLLGESRKAIEYYEQSLAIARQVENRKLEAYTLSNLGNAYLNLEEAIQAIEFFEQALSIIKGLNERQSEGAILGNLGWAHFNLNEPEKAFSYYEQALSIARDVGDRRNEGLWLGNLGRCQVNLGEVPKAIQNYEQGLRIAREIGDRRNEAYCLGLLGEAHERTGDHHKAILFYEQGLKIARETGIRDIEVRWLAFLGRIYRGIGELAKAKALWEQSLEICKMIESPFGNQVEEMLKEIQA